MLKNGEMQACKEFCPCSNCLLGQYTSCELTSEMGSMHRVTVPWLSGPPLHQLEQLESWGELLKAGMIVGHAHTHTHTHIHTHTQVHCR